MITSKLAAPEGGVSVDSDQSASASASTGITGARTLKTGEGKPQVWPSPRFCASTARAERYKHQSALALTWTNGSVVEPMLV